jgi:putative membrane protein insertion efficiency factor
MADPVTPVAAPRRIALALLRGYQRRVSPALPRRCRYEPTCSAYAATSVRRFGVFRGALLACWRLLRCNPFSHGGYDPVPARFTLRVGPVDPADHHEGAAT